MAASMVRLVHVIANACAKKLFRVPLVANISASHKTLQNCDLLLIYLLLYHTNIYWNKPIEKFGVAPGEPGCGTAYLVTFVQQHLYMILNLTYVTTILNEF